MALPNHHLPIALTMGDPAGIGPEIILKAFANHAALMQGCCVVGNLALMQGCCVVGNLALMHQHRHALAEHLPAHIECVEVFALNDALGLQAGQIPVCNVTPDAPISMGEVSAAAGRMAADAVRFAASEALAGRARAMVTAPLHKKALSLAAIDFQVIPKCCRRLPPPILGCQWPTCRCA